MIDYASYKIGGKSIEKMSRDELIGSLKAAMDVLKICSRARGIG